MTATVATAIWAIGIVVWVIIRMPRRRTAKRTKVITDRKSLSEKLALGLCIVGLVITPAIHIISPIFETFTYSFSPILAVLGAAVMVGFLVLFYFTHKQLAKNWSVTLEVREDHELIQSGLYGYMRHPMYTSFWLWGVAQALLINNWVAGFAGLVAVAILYFSRIQKEEAMMQEAFGDQYIAYSKKTARLIPGIY